MFAGGEGRGHCPAGAAASWESQSPRLGLERDREDAKSPVAERLSFDRDMLAVVLGGVSQGTDGSQK